MDDDIQDFEPFQLPPTIRSLFVAQRAAQEARNPRVAFATASAGQQSSTAVPFGVSPFVAPSDPNGGTDLISVRETGPFSGLFGFDSFNAVQSRCFDTAFRSDTSIVVAAPTASGKTAVAELAVCRMASSRGIGGGGKAIYLSPTKALCQQISADWSRRFGAVGVRCLELTGDSDPSDVPDLRNCDVVVSTPEKWDSVTRRWREHSGFIGDLSLVVIDEVHLIGSSRGATLEAVIGRMKAIRESPELVGRAAARLRFVALSATIPNAGDFAAWLGVPAEGLFVFGDEYRPVKLSVHVLGFPGAKNDFLFDRNLCYRIPDVLAQYSHGRPTLVFCSSRKGTLQTAQFLARDLSTKMLVRSGDDGAHQRALGEASAAAQDRSLAERLQRGVAFHTAGMSPQDRGLVERLFLSGSILVLCATSTLSMGVNLPAHLVVIKGTVCYRPGRGYEEMDDADVIQMVGRAGRPPFDTTAEAVVMTSAVQQRRWEGILGHNAPIDSTLLSHLPEHIAAEVALGSIASASDAVKWLRGSFAWQRVSVAPVQYGFPEGTSQECAAEEMAALCAKALRSLADDGLIRMSAATSSGDDDQQVSATELGRIQSRFYVACATMKLFCGLSGACGLSDLVDAISKSQELSDIHLRVSEKRPLNELNSSGAVRFPIKGRVTTDAHKVSLLLQAGISGGINDESNANKELDWGLRQDSQAIFRCAGRLCKCLERCVSERQQAAVTLPAAGGGDSAVVTYSALYNAVVLSKAVEQRLWETASPLMQLTGIGPALARSLRDAGIATFRDLEAADARRIESVCSRRPPFGEEVKSALHDRIPRLTLTVEEERAGATNGYAVLHIVTSVSCRDRDGAVCRLLVGNSDDKLLLHKRVAPARGNTVVQAQFLVRVSSPSRVTVVLVSERFVGVDEVRRLKPQLGSGQQCSPTIASAPSVVPDPQAQEVIPDDILDDPLAESHCGDDDCGDVPSFSLMPPSEKVKHVEVATTEHKQAVEVPKGEWCNHTCRSKLTCGHACCKGRTTQRRRQQKPFAPKQIHATPAKAPLQQLVTRRAAVVSQSASVPSTVQTPKRQQQQQWNSTVQQTSTCTDFVPAVGPLPSSPLLPQTVQNQPSPVQPSQPAPTFSSGGSSYSVSQFSSAFDGLFD